MNETELAEKRTAHLNTPESVVGQRAAILRGEREGAVEGPGDAA